uniref:E3 ubiquitin-protein ligase CHFR n=1 Tax=Nothobranchius furzeri TaxID=105023 RepID=A0A8C6L4M9_NOTFU
MSPDLFSDLKFLILFQEKHRAMDTHRGGRPWGKLVKVDSNETVLLFNKECTVGRKKGCHLSFPANKLVSGEHCKIVKNESSGLVWLEDMSTNGTVINMSKLVKKQSHMLQNGDVIYFVYRKSEPEQSESPKCDQGFPNTSRAGVSGSAQTVPGTLLTKPVVEGTKTDKMEESLTCVICQDLLHDCISLQPCMHVFCAACYSGWMERSSLCPTCRCPVERICKNHILNNLVEAYLIQHPDKCRSKEDLSSMDSRNKITQDMLQPKVERCYSDEEGSSDYLLELSDNDSDSSDISQPLVMCRQCPGYIRDMSQVLFATSSDYWFPGLPNLQVLSPSKPASPHEYRCPPQGYHLICSCCLQPMPDRRAEPNNQRVLAQQCTLCQRPFCHMYWGCQRIGCQGCLAPFQELNLTDKCLDGVLNNNNYESEILKNYLSSRGKSWKDLLQGSLHGLQQGSYFLTDCRISADTILCVCCGLRAFKELAYKYRQNIPPSELPADVASRPDCYWGRNCRTQVKTHHAVKFNHICEQTRFKS